MEIHLNEADIKTAIKRYVADMGIARPIDNVDFTVKRQGGTTVEAEIELADPSAEPHTASDRPVHEVGETQDTGAAEVTDKEEPEPAQTESPFEPDGKQDGVNDFEEEEPTSESKSLFS